MQLVDALRLTLEPGNPDIVALVGGGGKTSAMRRLTAEIAARGHIAIATTTTHIGVHQVQHWPAHIEIMQPQHLERLPDCLAASGQCLVVGPVDGQRHRGLSLDLFEHLRELAVRMDVAALVVEADGSRTRPLKAPDHHEPVVPNTSTLVAPVIGLDAVGHLLEAAKVHRPERIRALLNIPARRQVRITPQLVVRLLLHPQGGAKGRPDHARFMPLLNKAEPVISQIMGRIIARQLLTERVPCLLTTAGMSNRSAVQERWSPLALVILAAGRSQRMGQAKQLLPIDGVPMVVRALRTALDANIGDVYVVCGAYHQKVEQAVAKALVRVCPSQHKRVHMLLNQEWAHGQASSVHCAIHAMEQTTGAILFMPVDQPYLGAPLLRRLVEHWRKGALLCAPSVDGQVRGAPGLFDRALWPDLLAIKGDTGGRPVLQRYRDEVVTVAVAKDDLRDFDRPEDLPSN